MNNGDQMMRNQWAGLPVVPRGKLAKGATFGSDGRRFVRPRGPCICVAGPRSEMELIGSIRAFRTT